MHVVVGCAHFANTAESKYPPPLFLSLYASPLCSFSLSFRPKGRAPTA
jgi:hypothetical protein